MRRVLSITVEYLLGFLALAIFAFLAFASGSTSDERFVNAFKISSMVAVVELAVLFTRAAVANRLILGANIWLALGGAAAFLEQWWLLRVYQHFGEASLFASMFAVGVVSMAMSPAGFIGKAGRRSVVLQRSVLLLLAVSAALTIAVYYRGNVKYAADTRSLPYLGSIAYCGGQCRMRPNHSLNLTLCGGPILVSISFQPKIGPPQSAG